MRAKAFLSVCLLACSALAVHAFAQEGHPLKGTWLGDWGPSKADRNQVVVLMDYDGKQITGQINPGPNAIPIKTGQSGRGCDLGECQRRPLLVEAGEHIEPAEALRRSPGCCRVRPRCLRPLTTESSARHRLT